MDSALSENSILKEQFQRLMSLQELDKQIQGWDKQRVDLAQKVEQSKAEVKHSQESQAELKKAFEAQQKSRGLLELEIKTKQDAIKKYNGQLGELKTNEAYAAMMSEIKKCQEEIAKTEEKIIGLMENEESAKRKFEQDSSGLQQKTKEAEAGQAKMALEAKEFEDKVAGEQNKRQQLLDSLDKHFAEIYLRLYKPKKGMPMARILQGACEGCSMKVPQHLINEVRKVKGISYCQHCGRILVLQEN